MEETDAHTVARRPWLMSWIIIVLIGPPLTTAVFAGRLAQLTPTSREAERAAIARALGLDLPAPVSHRERREPLRDDIPQVANGPLSAHYSGYFWISVVDWH